MNKIWLVTLYDKYESGWLPDYARAFADKDKAEAHAEELRHMENAMEFQVVVNEVGYVA